MKSMEREIVVPVAIEEEMKSSYIDYAMSVIVGRALPDIRDGLKPVHRRILYAMKELGLSPKTPYKKCARIVGEVLGKYHPHGDVAVYDSLVRMAQDFSHRYPLIDGQGNFGSIDGDEAAAMRYTEARLSEVAEELLEDIDKETVPWALNFDSTLKEPQVLPSKFPNLLVNGSSGIAVGVTTSIPPHNLGEVVDGLMKMIDEPEISMRELLKIIKGPDFPTGGIIYGRRGIREAYETGRGLIKIRAKAEIKRGERTSIRITEIPYQVNKSSLLENIADLAREGKIGGISRIRDESDREGLRIVVELKNEINAEIVLNQLYKHTQMETTFGVINLALVDGEPKVLSLKELLQHYIDHRCDVIRRKTEFDLKNAENKLHIIKGFIVALSQLSKTIEIIRKAKSTDDAKNRLTRELKLTTQQASSILDLRLARLTSLEREKIEKEHKELLKNIARFKKILSSEKEILAILKNELMELKEKYGDGRRTRIVERAIYLGVEDLIPDEEMIVTITQRGYIKRLPVDTFRMQRRGGRGIIGTETKEDDWVRSLFLARAHDYILHFTSRGKVYWLKTYEVPLSGRYAKGKSIVNLLRLAKDESVTATIPVRELKGEQFLFFATKRGFVKKTPIVAFSNPRSAGIIAISLDKDELVDVKLTDGKQEIILATKNGKAIRFNEKDVREMGRLARGVRGIRLSKDDEVISMDVIKGETLLTITENGYGKRTKLDDYRETRRGGKGIINIKVAERNGKAVGICEVGESDEIILTTSSGFVIREPVRQIPVQGRNTQGVRLMSLQKEDKVVAVAKVIEEPA
jgi:DNA gyrase subunit A